MRKYILYGVIIFQVTLIISLIKGIQSSRRSAMRIADMQETKSKLEEEKENLKSEGKYVESEYYLEKVARDELHMTKPGETVVIVPDSRKLEVEQNQQNTEPVLEKENWERWWDVLSGRT